MFLVMNTVAFFYFIIFNCIVVFISWRKIKREDKNTSENFFLGNRSLNFVLVGGLLFLTNINGVQFIGENEAVYINNMSVMAWGVTSVVAMIIVAEFFMPIYLRNGIVTTPDFLAQRFDKSTKTWVSVIFLLSYLINMLPSVLYSGAVVFNGIFDFSDILHLDNWVMLWILIWLMGGLGVVYTIIGGIRLVAVSDVLLGSCLFIVGICLPYFGLKYLGNGNLTEGVQILLSTKTEHFNAIGSPKDNVPFNTLFTGMLLVNLNYWGMEQYIVQRALASKNLAESQKGIALAAVGKLLSPLMLNIPGVIAVHLYPNMTNTAEIFPRLAGDVLPSILVGLVAAVILGAAITSFNAGLSSGSALFVLNLYKPFYEKKHQKLSDIQLIRVGKRFQLFAAFAAMLIAPFIALAKNGFYNYLQMVGGAFNVPIFTIIFMGFVTRKMPPLAAKVGLVFFVATYILLKIVLNVDLHFLHLLTILFLITITIMLVIGKLYPLPIPYEKPIYSAVNIQPWRGRYLYYAVLILAMIGLYIIFSPLVLVK